MSHNNEFWIAIASISVSTISFLLLFIRWRMMKGEKKQTNQTTRIDLTIWVQPKKGSKKMNKVKITTEMQVKLTAKFTTLAGIIGAIFGKPQWASSDESVAKVIPSDDGLTCEVVSVADGTATISVHAEGDEQPGVAPLDSSVEVLVVDPEDSLATITIGTPELKPVISTPAAPATGATDGQPAATGSTDGGPAATVTTDGGAAAGGPTGSQ